MDVVEFIIHGALSLWGPPVLLTAYLPVADQSEAMK